MDIHFAISTGALVIIGLSIALFIATTWLCYLQGMFDGSPDTYGVGAIFTMFFYMLFWGIPTLVIWAVWATWFK